MPKRAKKVKFPCIFCCKEVENYHNAILCISCNKWAHLKCSRASYETFISDENWTCDVCLFKELPQNVPQSPGITISHQTE